MTRRLSVALPRACLRSFSSEGVSGSVFEGEMPEECLRRIGLEKARRLRADHFRACKHGVRGKLEPDGIALRNDAVNPRMG